MTRTLTLAMATVIAFGGIATAQPTSRDGMQTVVSFADLNLDSEAGAQALISRIHSAADRVCGGQPDLRELDRRTFYQACVKQAMDRAIASIDRPVVTENYWHVEGSKLASN